MCIPRTFAISTCTLLTLGCALEPRCSFSTSSTTETIPWLQGLPGRNFRPRLLGPSILTQGKAPDWLQATAIVDPILPESLRTAGDCSPEFLRNLLETAWSDLLKAPAPVSAPARPVYRIQCRAVSAEAQGYLGRDSRRPWGIFMKTTEARAELWFRVLDESSGRVVCSARAYALSGVVGIRSTDEAGQLLQKSAAEQFHVVGIWLGLIPPTEPLPDRYR